MDSGEETVPSEVRTYLDLNFAEGNQLWDDLLRRVPGDRATSPIPVNDEGGPNPAFLTPEMDAWYTQHVAAARMSALQRIRSEFEADHPYNGAKGFLVEAETDRIDDQLLKEKTAERARLRGLRGVQHNRRRELLNQIEIDREQFEERKAAYRNRDPQMTPFWVYVAILLAVGTAEMFINFEAFASLSWASPFIAFGMASVIGLAIALAAHMHGTLLKQIGYYFDDDVDRKERGAAYRLFGIGTSVLIIALWAVYYARDAFIIQSIGADIILGTDNQSGTHLWLILGSMLGNMLVYGVGVILAYLLHDKDPSYPELRKRLDRSEAELAGIQQALAREEEMTFRAAETRARKLRDESVAKDKPQKQAPNYNRNREWFKRVAGQDQTVIAALTTYRIRLVSGAPNLVFARTHFDDGEASRRLAPAEYQKLTLKLKYN